MISGDMGGVMKPMSTPHREESGVDGVVADPRLDYVDLGHTGFGDLPESCIALILRFVAPKDISNLGCTSRAFRDAALSDMVWQAKLPDHRTYTEVIAEATEAPPASSSKKSVYISLCHGLLLKERNEAFWLDGATGGVCRSQGARALYIIWGGDKRYWSWLSLVEGSSFLEVGYLKAVCWLEIRGSMECTLPVGTYTLFWRLSLAVSLGRSQSFELQDHAYGLTWKPVSFSLTANDGEPVLCEHKLDAHGESSENSEPRLVHENWAEFVGGDFIVEEGEKGSGVGRVKLKYTMIEINGGQWKGGMFLDGVVIRPSDLKSKRTPVFPV